MESAGITNSVYAALKKIDSTLSSSPKRDHAAIEFAQEQLGIEMFSGVLFDIIYIAFRAGAKWDNDSQWISVEEELPPYDEVVAVTCFELGRRVTPWWLTKRSSKPCITKDKNEFIVYKINEQATHWKKIA